MCAYRTGCCMSLLVVGINHNSASLALRERVSFAPESMSDALRSLSASLGDIDVAILSNFWPDEIGIRTSS